MLKEKAGALAGQIWEALNGTEQRESVIFAGEYGKICKGNIVSVADSCFS